jgi:hypothetical protein
VRPALLLILGTPRNQEMLLVLDLSMKKHSGCCMLKRALTNAPPLSAGFHSGLVVFGSMLNDVEEL